MVLSIIVGISVGLAQIDRWTDAWTDRCPAKIHQENRKQFELGPILAQSVLLGPLSSFYLPPVNPPPTG